MSTAGKGAALVVVAPDGTVLSWNDDATAAYGYPASEAVGRPVLDLLAVDRLRAGTALAAVRSGRLWHGVLPLRHAEGGLIDSLVALLPIHEGSEVTAVAAVAVPAVRDAVAAIAPPAETALDAAGMGVWDWDVIGGALSWDDRVAELHGVDPATFTGDMDGFFARVHPDDLMRLQGSVQRALATFGPYTEEYRVVRPDGSTRWVQGRGRAFPDVSGSPARMVGIGVDTTGLRDARDRAARMLDHLNDGVLLFDSSWTISYVNDAGARLLARHRDDLVGTNARDAFPAAVEGEIAEQYRTAVESQEIAAFEVFYGPVDGWFELRMFASPDGLAVVFRDVNARHQADADRAALLEAERTARADAEAARADVETARRRIAFLARASADLAGSLREHEVLDTLTRLVVADWADWCCVYLSTDNGLALAAARHRDAGVASLIDEPALTSGAPETSAALARVYREGVAELDQHIASGLVADGPSSSPLTERARALGIRSAILAPLGTSQGRIGVLAMFRADGPPLTADDLTVGEQLAARAALAVQNARLYEHQRSVAVALQDAVLPEALPEVPGWALAARYLPATAGASVGGDFYDAYVADDRVVLTLGDVAGHGLRAAAVMGQVRNAVRAFTLDHLDPDEVMARARRLLRTREPDELVTMLFGVLDPHSGRLAWAGAGHPPPVLVRADGAVTLLEGPGCPPLGSPPAPNYPSSTSVLTIAPGDTLVWYSDGLVERRGEDLDDGLARLVEVAPLLNPTKPESIDAALAELVPGSHRADDICLLVVRREL